MVSQEALQLYRLVGGPVTLLALAAGCGGSPRSSRGTPPPGEVDASAYPTALRDPATVPGSWALDQEVTIRHPEGEHSFRAVLEKNAGTLTLVVLAPHGARAFALTQRGRRVDYTPFVDLPLPFPPEFMMYDVHRTWLQEPVEGDGDERTGVRSGERVVERWDQALLLERSFERLDGEPEGRIVVRYPGGISRAAPSRSAPPERVVLDNGWFGYEVELRTLSWTPLAGPEEDPSSEESR